MNKLALSSTGLICLAVISLGLVLTGCQTTKIATPTTQNTQTNINLDTTTQAISLQQLKENRWLVNSIINSDGYMLNLTQWKSGTNLAYFEFWDNKNKASYSHLTNMDDLTSFTFGCNSFSAGVNLVGNRLIIDKSIMGTLMGCGMTEEELTNALKGENQLSYNAKQNQITLTTHNNYRFILTGSPIIEQPALPTLEQLQSYDWRLLVARDSQKNNLMVLDSSELMPENTAKLRFDINKIHYSVGCNQLSDSFQLTPKGMATKANTLSTMMACPPALAKAETLLQQLLQGPTELGIRKINSDEAVLTQTTSNGSELMWHGELRPETKYGDGEILFFEIAPQQRPCDGLTDKCCLMVREVTYNSQGLKTHLGVWRLLYEPIEGYHHLNDHQPIIRVKRYRTPPQDTKGYGNQYVFDRVIDSQRGK